MVDRIRLDTCRPVVWPDLHATQPIQFKPPATQETRAAEEEAASFYYLSTIKSLQASMDTPTTPSSTQAATAINEKKTEKSFIGKVSDWLWNLLGFKTTQPPTEPTAEKTAPATSVQPMERIPKLPAPNAADSAKLSKAVAELNRELVARLKENTEFEEEMRKATTNQRDKLIMIQLISSSIAQKQLREQSGIDMQDSVLSLHRKNKALKEAHYNLQNEIAERAKTNRILGWIDLGSTIGIFGTLAASFATGGLGGVIGFALPLFCFSKGTTTLTTGILKYKNDIETGKLVLINNESKRNSTDISDKLNIMNLNDEEIGALLKTIRHHLDNQSQATRAMLGRS